MRNKSVVGLGKSLRIGVCEGEWESGRGEMVQGKRQEWRDRKMESREEGRGVGIWGVRRRGLWVSVPSVSGIE